MEGMGEGEVEEIWKKDEEGRMVLGLERRSLFISNHQVSRRSCFFSKDVIGKRSMY